MKSTGIVRRLDELGRITLPIELRRNFDVNERDPLEIFVDDDKIILKVFSKGASNEVERASDTDQYHYFGSCV